MHRIQAPFHTRFVVPLFVTALAGCGGSAQNLVPATTSVNPVSPSYAALQVAVGTANIDGTPGLNITETFRQTNGLSAVLYSTPTVTWSGTMGPNAAAHTLDGATPNVDDGKNQISGTPAIVLGGPTPPVSTFGQGVGSWGAFGEGFFPGNLGQGAQSQAQLVFPGIPVYGSPATQLQYAGGPPAFPSVRNANGLGNIGQALGFTVFQGLTPAAPTAFTLSVLVPTGFVGSAPQTGTVSASAKLSNAALLNAGAPLRAPVFAPDGNGGGFITYAFPSGATEAYLFVVDQGSVQDANGNLVSCHFNITSGSPPLFYTVRVTGGSPNPVGLGYTGGTNDPGDNLGPNPTIGTLPAGSSTHSICTQADNSAADTSGAGGVTGNAFTAYAAGFDYPASASSSVAGLAQEKPAISNAAGQADIVLSASTSGVSP